MATGIKIPVFRETTEDWESFTERLEAYFRIHKTPKESQVDTLIAGLTGSQYQTLKSLVSPAKPVDKKLEELIAAMGKHYVGQKNPRTERYKFKSIVRAEGESIQNFAVRLREAARHCQFAGGNLDENLVDQFLAGVNLKEVVKKVVENTEGLKLSFQSAVDIALEVEEREKGTKDFIHDTHNVHNVSQPARHNFKNPRSASFGGKKCFRCNSTSHLANTCKHKETVCHGCNKKGHLKAACLSGSSKPGPGRQQQGQRNSSAKGQHEVSVPAEREEVSQVDSDENCEYNNSFIWTIEQLSTELNVNKVDLTESDRKITVPLMLNAKSAEFHLDTGAVVSCIGENTYNNFCKPGDKLMPTDLKLNDYNRKPIEVLGVARVDVVYGDQSKQLPLVVVRGDRTPLFGRNWLREIKLDWGKTLKLKPQVHNVAVDTTSVEQLCEKYKEAFEPGLGCLKDFEVNIAVKTDAVPVYKKARSVPYHLRPMVEAELKRLEESGVIKSVAYSEWASPIVSVVKSGGESVRICADFKETLNPVTDMAHYPLPTPEDIFATLASGQSYTKLDLSHAYHQLKLSEEAQAYMVINTHKGLFAYQRLQFGIHSAVGIFQRTMENVLKDIPHCAVYIDDVIISGPTEAEHMQTLDTVLKRLNEAGLKLNREKCSFMQPEVKYLGHTLSAQGIQPLTDKVKAIQAFKVPQTKQELSTFCGMVKYYHRFLPNISQVMAPLFALEKERKSWDWTQEQDKAFNTVKQLLASDTLLVHYNPNRPLVLTCDASAYGLGAALEQEIEPGVLKPVSFASRTLSVHEKNYCQTEKEGLAVVWSVSKFSKYLYGRSFEIRTDHKPLLGLLGEGKAIPSTASGRIIRWGLQLAAYDYQLVYKPGSKIANADCLSRFPLQVNYPEPPSVGEEVLLLECLAVKALTADSIRRWTDRDPLLSRVRSLILEGWPEGLKAEELQPYYQKRHELSVLDGCLLWGGRVVIPPQGRERVTEELHATHPGIVKMKSLARCYLWWPAIDKDLEHKVKTCLECQSVRSFQTNQHPVHPWEFPSKPWSRLHIDYAGPFEGKMFLVVKDAYSKWVEVFPTTGSSATVTINKLRGLFATHGLPHLLVSDNASAFMGQEFQEFLAKNGIRHVTGAPYHPATNGLAENAVKSFKEAMKKTDGNLELRLNRFLFDYRVTPHVTTGIPPCELLMNRRVRTRFDLLKPSLEDSVLKKQEAQVKGRGKAPELKLETGDHVYYKNYSKYGPPNIPGTVESRTGPVSCLVRGPTGQLVRRHYSQLFKMPPPESVADSSSKETKLFVPTARPDQPGMDTGIEPNQGDPGADPGQESQRGSSEPTGQEPVPLPVTSLPDKPSVEQPVRRSLRERKPVERLITSM